MAQADELVDHQSFRGRDEFGSGRFGAPRGGGVRSHDGVDIIVNSGDSVKSPISGVITRLKYPYSDDLSYHGCVIKGNGEWKDYELTIYYVKLDVKVGVTVELGQVIGKAQDVSKRYPGITKHVHLEVKKAGELVNPATLWINNK